MTIIELLKFIFEDGSRIFGFFFILLALGWVISALIPKITIVHNHYNDKKDSNK